MEVTIAQTGILAGKIAEDKKLEEAEQHNQQFDHEIPGQEHPKAPPIRSISALYAVPHQITPHSYELLPDQPEMHFNYKLVARFKRDPEKKIQRAWATGDNAGRDARAVAAEIATGIRPEFVNWSAKFGPSDDSDDLPFEDLPPGFDDFIQPEFPEENETFRAFAQMDLEEDEDEDNLPELQVQAGGGQSGYSSSNPFNRTSLLPNKRGREAGQSQPVLTAAGYTKIVEPSVKEEVFSEDSEDEEEKEKRKKQHASFFKKKKPSKAKSPEFTVPKREDSDDEGWA